MRLLVTGLVELTVKVRDRELIELVLEEEVCVCKLDFCVDLVLPSPKLPISWVRFYIYIWWQVENILDELTVLVDIVLVNPSTLDGMEELLVLFVEVMVVIAFVNVVEDGVLSLIELDVFNEDLFVDGFPVKSVDKLLGAFVVALDWLLLVNPVCRLLLVE